MQFPTYLNLIIVFQTDLLSSFICQEGDVCQNHYRKPNPREGKELQRRKSAKGDMLAACSNQSSNHFNNTLASHPFPNVSSAMLQVGLTFLRGQDSEWNTAQGNLPSNIIKKKKSTIFPAWFSCWHRTPMSSTWLGACSGDWDEDYSLSIYTDRFISCYSTSWWLTVREWLSI